MRVYRTLELNSTSALGHLTRGSSPSRFAGVIISWGEQEKQNTWCSNPNPVFCDLESCCTIEVYVLY